MLTHPPFGHLLQLLDFLLDLLGLREVTQEVEIVFLVGPVDLRRVPDAQSQQKLLVRDVAPSLCVIAFKNKNDVVISNGMESGLAFGGPGPHQQFGGSFLRC